MGVGEELRNPEKRDRSNSSGEPRGKSACPACCVNMVTKCPDGFQGPPDGKKDRVMGDVVSAVPPPFLFSFAPRARG